MKLFILRLSSLFLILSLACKAQEDWVSLNAPVSSEVFILAPTIFGSWFALLPPDNINNRHYQILASWDDRQSWTSVRTVIANERPILQTDHQGNKYLFYETFLERSTDEGIIWGKTDYQRGITFLSQGLDYRLILTTGAGIYISSNSGGSWKHIQTPAWFKATTSGKDGTLYALGSTNFYRSTDNGSTWSSVRLSQFGFDEDVYIRSDSRNNIFVRAYSRLLRSTNAGTTWDTVSTPIKDIAHVQVSGSGLIHISGRYDQMAVSSDLGNSWTVLHFDLPNGNAIHSLTMDSHDNLIFASQYGGFRYDPTAKTLERLFSSGGNLARAERLGTLAGTLLPLTSDGIPYLYDTVNGKGHVVSNIATIQDSVRGAVGTKDFIMFSGTRELASSTDAGLTWKMYTIDTSFRYIKPPLASPTGIIYLPVWKEAQSRLQFHGIYLTSDNGNVWNKLSCNINAPDYLYVDANGALYILDGFLLWKSSDAGITFDVYQLPNTPVYFRVTRDGEWFSVFSDSLYATTDFGQTWRNTGYLEANTISFIVKNGAGHTYIGRSSGLIWKSETDSAPWKLHTTGLPLVEILDIVSLDDNYLYLGTRNGLYRSTRSYRPTSIDEMTDQSYTLSQSYPNPVSAGESTTIAYTLPQGSDVTINVYSILGVEIYSAAFGWQSIGTHTCSLPTRGLKPGVYQYMISHSSGNQTKSMIVR